MVIGVVVLGLLLGTVQVASAEPTPGAAGIRPVTLITGDRVLLGDTGAAQGIHPAAGRERMSFSTYPIDDHRYVVPADATRLVATGRLDRRLFDVTTLVELGYDDTKRSTLPLIVTYSGAPMALGDAVAIRPGVFDVSTKVSATWAFRSGHVAGTANLPLLAVRFLPRLDPNNAAPVGPFLIPIKVERQPGDQVRPQRLAVDVSYDEGKTWHKADVFVNRAVRLHHPANASSVSLRASATDRDGNTVEQTIIRAYKLVARRRTGGSRCAA